MNQFVTVDSLKIYINRLFFFRKGPNLIKQLKKSLSKSGSFSRDSQPKLAVVRRNSRDDDSVSVERNNDSSSFGSRTCIILFRDFINSRTAIAGAIIGLLLVFDSKRSIGFLSVFFYRK